MSDFAKKVFHAIEKIPEGKVATYGQIAMLAGHPGAYRAVGNILHTNPTPVTIPCHRVVTSSGKLAKCFGFGGPSEQKRLLEAEGVRVSQEFKLDMKIYLWRWEEKYE